MKVLMHHSQQAARSFVRGLEIRLKYGVIVSKLSVNKYNIFAYPLCFEIKNRRQGPKTAGYRRKPAAISNPVPFCT
jgi:hypothetical protein